MKCVSKDIWFEIWRLIYILKGYLSIWNIKYINIVIHTTFFKRLEITVIHSYFNCLFKKFVLRYWKNSCLQYIHQTLWGCSLFVRQSATILSLGIHLRFTFSFSILCNVTSQFLVFSHFCRENCFKRFMESIYDVIGISSCLTLRISAMIAQRK